MRVRFPASSWPESRSIYAWPGCVSRSISGSFHFTPGQAYEEANNGNQSQVHWDMVCIQRPEWGGGEIYFDNELIRKDGLFLPDDLKVLNPDNLLSS